MSELLRRTIVQRRVRAPVVVFFSPAGDFAARRPMGCRLAMAASTATVCLRSGAPPGLKSMCSRIWITAEPRALLEGFVFVMILYNFDYVDEVTFDDNLCAEYFQRNRIRRLESRHLFSFHDFCESEEFGTDFEPRFRCCIQIDFKTELIILNY
jgi:hypothetical protein